MYKDKLKRRGGLISANQGEPYFQIMKNILSISLLSLASLTCSQADDLATWELDSLDVDQVSAVASSHAANLTVGKLMGGSEARWPDALVVLRHDSPISSLASALVADDYFSFTIHGSSASYESIFMRITVQANAFPATTEFSLLSSVTGFGEGAVALDTFSVEASQSGANHGTGTLDLSKVAALQNVSGEIEFRIYYYDAGANPMTRIGIGQAFATNGSADLVVTGSAAEDAAEF